MVNIREMRFFFSCVLIAGLTDSGCIQTGRSDPGEASAEDTQALEQALDQAPTAKPGYEIISVQLPQSRGDKESPQSRSEEVPSSTSHSEVHVQARARKN